MSLVSNRFILEKAKKGNYAVGAFNISNLEMIKAVAETSNKLRSPVILQVSESAIRYAGFNYLKEMVYVAASENKIPVSLHLDHGKDMDVVRKCINKGFTSVMFDGSSFPYDKNVKLTGKVVSLARKRNISVEGELGTLSGVEDDVKSEKILYTDPFQAKDFVDKTSVDSLAIAIGTSHGAYKFTGNQKLRIDILREVRKKVNVPLVLHGASGVPKDIVRKASLYGLKVDHAKGVPDSEIKAAIDNGICKVNIDTDNRLAFSAGIREIISKKPEVFDPREILGNAMIEMKNLVEHKILLFKSNNKV